MKKLWIAVAAAVLLLTPLGLALAAEAPPLALNERARDIRALQSAQLSPDGREAALVITASTAEGGQTHIWLSKTDGSGVRQLTYSGGEGEPGERAPAWSPDGAYVYFMAKRGGGQKLLRLPTAGGEAVALVIARNENGTLQAGWGASSEDGVEASPGSYSVSPDGRWIAVIATDGDLPARAADVKKKNDAVRVGRDDISRDRLYLVDSSTGAAREATLPDQAQEVRWRPTSDQLVVVTGPPDDDLGPANKVWKVAVPDLNAIQLKDLPVTTSEPLWTKSRLVYAAQCADDTPQDCFDIYVWDVETHAVRNLTQGLKSSLAGLTEVTLDGREVVAFMRVGVKTQMVRFDLATGARTWVDFPLPVVFGFSTNDRHSGYVVQAGGPLAPRAAYFVSKVALSTGQRPAWVKLALPKMWPDDWPMTQSQLVHWTNHGLTIEGLIYLPKITTGAKAPLVVNVHGGPAGVFDDSHSNLVALLVAEGYAVLQPNPRGSTGYGTAFLAANRNDLGGRDYEDIMAGVDTVLAKFPLDRSRMALIGYSYGGEMAGFVEGRTDRFKALVSGAPVINQFSEYGTEPSSYYERFFYGKPWEHFADAWRQSPLATVGRARTPLLLLQGEEDANDPLGQAQEMRRAMAQVGAPVVLVTYPRENHRSLGLAFKGEPTREPWHGVDLRRRMLQFLADAFAGNDPTAAH